MVKINKFVNKGGYMELISGGCVVIDVFGGETQVSGKNIFIRSGELTFNIKGKAPLNNLIKQTFQHYNQKLSEKTFNNLNLDITNKGGTNFKIKIK